MWRRLLCNVCRSQMMHERSRRRHALGSSHYGALCASAHRKLFMHLVDRQRASVDAGKYRQSHQLRNVKVLVAGSILSDAYARMHACASCALTTSGAHFRVCSQPMLDGARVQPPLLPCVLHVAPTLRLVCIRQLALAVRPWHFFAFTEKHL